jgi:hypothetical protein
MSLFQDPNLLGVSWISGLTDEELKNAVNSTKATLETVKGSTSEWFVRKNLENLLLEVKRRSLIIVGSDVKAVAFKFNKNYLYLGVAIITLGIGGLIILKKRKK